MDNNPVTTPQVANPLPQMTQPPQPQTNVGRTIVLFISAILIVIVLAVVVYMMVVGSAKKGTYTAQVSPQPTVQQKQLATPTPSTYQISPKDTSDNAIDKDTQATNQNLNNLDTDLNNAEQSFNDQETNLQ